MQAQLDEMMDQYKEMRSNLVTMQEECLRVQATAYSEDGHVVVTVGPRGHLLGIRIDPVVNRRSNTDELCASIMEAVDAAVGTALEEVATITRRYAPDVDLGELGDFDLSSLLQRSDASMLREEER